MNRFPHVIIGMLLLLSGAIDTSLALGNRAAQSSPEPAGPSLQVMDWLAAESQGWVLYDRRARRYDGRIEAEKDLLRLLDDQDGRGESESAHHPPARLGAAAVFPHDLRVPERFAIILRARFLKLGQDDDSTGMKSNLRLSLGVKTPRGRFGVGFLFTADRYKVDREYKVYRTDTAWHTWRFEVDALRKTVAMCRDGAYVCMHNAGSRQPSGVRIQVQGAAAVPAEVEIGSLLIEPMPPPPNLTGARARPPSPSFAPGEWPMWRRDVRNTGVSPLVGAIRQPRIVWQFDVGKMPALPVFLDLDGDDVKEALISHGGNLTAYRVDGEMLWRTRMENAAIHGVFDLDGDGKRELLITSGVPSLVRVLDVHSGSVRYTCTLYPKAGVAGIRVARLSPQKRGLQAIVWSPQHEIGFRLSFDQGIENAQVDWTFNWRVTNFTPAVLLADMNRDGIPDVVVNTYDRTFVFDGDTGKKRMDLQWPSGRNYGTTVAQDVDGDGFPDVVVLADYLREHIAVLKNEGGKSLHLLWDRFYEQNYPDDFKTLRLTLDSVGDFDGDGRMEIAAALYDSRADAVWHTFLLDALTGAVKQDIPGRYLVGAGPLYPGRPPVLLLSPPSNRADLNLDRLSIWSAVEGRLREVEALPKGTLLPASSFREFPLNAWTTTLVNTSILRPLSASRSERGLFLACPSTSTGEPVIEFLTGSRDGGLIVRQIGEPAFAGSPAAGALPAESTGARQTDATLQTTERVLDVAEVIPGTGEPQRLVARPDGALCIRGPGGRVYGCIRANVGFITQPVVARLRRGERPSILYMDSSGNLCCRRSVPGGRTPSLLWSQPALGYRPRMVAYLESQGVPVVVDLDGDGDREVLAARAPDSLLAFDADGNQKRAWKFPALPTQWTFGYFDADDLLDLFVSWPSGAFVDMDSAAISGKDGTTLGQWHCGNGPPAVFDFNGDGRDDILLRDLFERRTLDTATGRDIFPITLWAGYHIPVILPLGGQERPPGVVWVGGAYSVVAEGEVGRQSWWKPFRATGPQAVADVDGDGRYEIGGVTAGQLYNWPEFYAVDGPDKEFLCYDALSGRLKWSYPLGVTSSGATAADLDGDGKREFLLGTADGRLIALRGEANAEKRVLWELSFPAALGPPIVCDVEGDGAMSILVGCADGQLYCISSERAN